MLKKRKIRELAMQVLFAWDVQGAADKESAGRIVEEGAAEADVRARAMEMALGVWDHRAEYDQRMERLAPQWPPRRQPIVDRNLIRQAIWELTTRDTPPKVVLDEAIELAKTFSTEQSGSFVNGVLDAVLREHRQLLQERTPGTTPGMADGQGIPAPNQPPPTYDI